jgi:hypothetical protein
MVKIYQVDVNHVAVFFNSRMYVHGVMMLIFIVDFHYIYVAEDC